MPTPASQPEEQRVASPVPRYSVFCFLSVGSRTRAPVEFWSSSSGASSFQSGSGAVALSVRQTPPPAAVAQTRQWFGLQSGATTIALIRLAVWLVAPVKAVTPGWIAAVRGP